MARSKFAPVSLNLSKSSSLEHTVRGERLRIVAALAAHCGDLDLAEESFAEACARGAAQASAPDDWAAWLYRTALNAVIDRKRRAATASRFADDLNTEETAMPASPIPDQRLALIFACCHPSIDATARVALTLTTICGLTAAQVASAFLVPPATMSQRLVRAKRKLAGAGIVFEIPDARFWPERLETVLATIEIAYARGHGDAAGAGEDAAYAAQMIELTELLATMLPRDVEVRALATTLCLSQARRPARLDDAGKMVPLSEQDPARWDKTLLVQGRRHFTRMTDGGMISTRTIQAGLQAIWCSRTSRDDPAPWAEILAAYDHLLALDDSPFVRLNRAVALAEVAGPGRALAEMSDIPHDAMQGHPAYHAVRAGLLRKAGKPSEAIEEYGRAIAAQDNPAERAWLTARRSELQD